MAAPPLKLLISVFVRAMLAAVIETVTELHFDVVWERALMETSAGYFPYSIKL